METIKISNKPHAYPNKEFGICYSSTIIPVGKVIGQNSTHVAIQDENKIKIYIKGLEIGGDERNLSDNLYTSKPEYLYSIPLENKEDLDSIFDNYEEDNRCNLAEINGY